MVKAGDLIKQQKDRENRKNITFDKILLKIEKKIEIASSGNYYYTWYSIPEFIIGLPMYSLNECKVYITQKLKDNGFEITCYDPNLMLVKWFPKNK